jgi:hypothetical protein
MHGLFTHYIDALCTHTHAHTHTYLDPSFVLLVTGLGDIGAVHALVAPLATALGRDCVRRHLVRRERERERESVCVCV